MVIFTLREMGVIVVVKVVVVGGGEGGLAEELGECAVEVLVVLSLGVKWIGEGK